MLKYALLGGAGGLAPATCQFLAMFLPNIFAGADKTQRALASLPTTSGLLFIDFIVLVAVFAIAAGVVIVTLDREVPGAAARAFLLGVSVPAMIISMGSGLSAGNAPTGAEKKNTETRTELAQPWSVADAYPRDTLYGQARLIRAGFIPASADTADLALVGGKTAEFQIVVTCPACPDGTDLSSVVNRVTVTAATSSPEVVDATQGTWHQLPSNGQVVMISVLGYTESSANSQIWRSAKTQFSNRDGGRWTVTIALRPGVWNNIRAFFALPAYYVIDSMTPTRSAPA